MRSLKSSLGGACSMNGRQRRLGTQMPACQRTPPELLKATPGSTHPVKRYMQNKNSTPNLERSKGG